MGIERIRAMLHELNREFAAMAAGHPLDDDPEKALFANLPPRQREIASLLVLGRTNGEIATELSIAKRTAEYQVARILRAFGLRRRVDLVAL